MTITTRLLDAADAARFQTVRLRAVDTAPTSFLPTLDEESQVPVDEFATRITPTHERAVYGAFDGDARRHHRRAPRCAREDRAQGDDLGRVRRSRVSRARHRANAARKRDRTRRGNGTASS